MRMCLAEAGFVEGRDFVHLGSTKNDGYAIWYNHAQDTPELRGAIGKASEIASSRVIPYEEWHGGEFTCGDPKERRAV